MELNKILILLVIIISVLDINYYNIYMIPILMIILSFMCIKIKNKQNQYLLGISILLLTTKFLYNKDKFSNFIMTDDVISQTKYCLPLNRDGKCPNNLNPSLNDPNWCCMGPCYCYQKEPPTTCQKKYSWGACPYKEQNTSIDDPKMCCFGENCSCGVNKTVPPVTTCGGKPRYCLEEETVEEENPNNCPCKKDLVCTRVIPVIPVEKPKPVTPTIPSQCQAYLGSNTTTTTPSTTTTTPSTTTTNSTSTSTSTNKSNNNFIKIPSPSVDIYKVENPLDPLIYDSSKYWDSRKHL